MDSTYSGAYNTTESSSIMVWLLVLVVLLMYFMILALMIASLWKLYTKADKPGWAAIIPYYQTIVKMEIIGRPIWWFAIIAFVPIINIWFDIVATLDFAKSYGKSVGFGVLLILLPVVGYPLLAFGKDTNYIGPVAEGEEGFMPATGRGVPPALPTNMFVPQPPEVSGPTAMSAGTEPQVETQVFEPAATIASSTEPIIVPSTMETTEWARPDDTVVADEPLESGQPPVDELVAANLPDISEPEVPSAPQGPADVPAPEVSLEHTAMPSRDTGQPLPPKQ